jgi:flagellar motor switch protein FliN/FliY
MQILPLDTAKKIVSIMMGNETPEPVREPIKEKPAHTSYSEPAPRETYREPEYESRDAYREPAHTQPPVEVHKAAFQPLKETAAGSMPRNIDLILDVPLEISVVLGRTKKNIKEILNLGTGSLIELDKLAEEPVEILVNGKIVAFGEVIVVDENFGVRITNIVSGAERVKSLSK